MGDAFQTVQHRALLNGDVLSSTIFIFVGPDGKQIMPRVGGSGQNAVKVVYGIAVDR
jgi:hypothetical protein